MKLFSDLFFFSLFANLGEAQPYSNTTKSSSGNKAVALLLRPVYPGTIWSKRLRHLLILFTISINIFLNQIQNQLFQTAERAINWSESIASPMIANAGAAGESLIPKIEAIEASKFGWIIQHFDLLSAQSIEQSVGKMQSLQKQLRSYGGTLQLAATLLAWMQTLLWGTIAYSCIWISCDLYFGRTRRLLLLAIAVAVIVNIAAYAWLHAYIGTNHQLFTHLNAEAWTIQ